MIEVDLSNLPESLLVEYDGVPSRAFVLCQKDAQIYLRRPASDGWLSLVQIRNDNLALVRADQVAFAGFALSKITEAPPEHIGCIMCHMLRPV